MVSASSLPAAESFRFTGVSLVDESKASEPRHSWLGSRPKGLPAALQNLLHFAQSPSASLPALASLFFTRDSLRSYSLRSNIGESFNLNPRF